MARGKNSPALFDVIHAAKRPPKASPTGGGVPTPKHWFKGKPMADQAADRAADRSATDPAPHRGDPDPAPAEVPTGTRRSWLAAARQQAAVPPPPPVDPVDADPADDAAYGDAYGDEPADDPSPVVITRVYPPDVTQRPAAEAYAEEDTAELPPVPLQPLPAARPAAAEPAADDKPTWAERRAKVLAERSRSSDPSFDPTADVTPADLRSPTRPAKAAAVDEDPAPRPTRRPAPSRAEATAKLSSSSSSSSSSARPAPADLPVEVDHEAGEVRFRLSYVGAALAAVILLLVLAIAYLAGQRSGTAESALNGGVGRGAVARAGGSAAPLLAATSPAAVPQAAVSQTVVPPVTAAPPAEAPAPVIEKAVPPPAAAEPVARQAGQLYVVMLSYPDRETAKRAAAFLNRNGVPCDVVAGPAGFAMRDWSSVVGTDPIAPRDAHAPAVQERLRAIIALGPKFSPKAYNQFAPQLYTWRADSDAPRP